MGRAMQQCDRPLASRSRAIHWATNVFLCDIYRHDYDDNNDDNDDDDNLVGISGVIPKF
jgi:hypothetical protein